MNTREKLQYLRDLVTRGVSPFGDLTPYTDLIDQLIAERPYEPGETVTDDKGTPLEFCCIHPRDSSRYIFRYAHGGLAVREAEQIKRPPKTYRLKPVPEEVMRDARWAQSISPDDDIHDAAGKARAQSSVCEYLTNPDNWEE